MHHLHRPVWALALGGITALTAVPALATPAAIDGFAVVRPVSGVYADEFNDGVAPPTGGPSSSFDGGTLATYSLNSGASFAAGAESGGLLSFAGATFGPSCTSFGCNASVQVTLQTSTAAGSTNGLRQNQDFLVYANWAFTTPDGGERYRLRLGDTFRGTSVSNDVVDIDVVRTSSGQAQVRLLDVDLSSGVATVINSVTLAPGLTATNLVMSFEHQAFTNTVEASFRLYNGVTPVMASYTLGTATLFNGEDATQAGFGVFAPVPEPASGALLAAGLGWLAWRRRRQA